MGYVKIQNTGISSAQFSLDIKMYIELTHWNQNKPQDRAGQSNSGKNGISADQNLFCTSGRQKNIIQNNYQC